MSAEGGGADSVQIHQGGIAAQRSGASAALTRFRDEWLTWPKPCFYVLAGAMAVAVHFVLGLIRLRRGSFIEDDYMHFINSKRVGLSPDLLLEKVFDQFVPLHRVVSAFFIEGFGLNYAAAAAVIVGISALTPLLAAALCARARTGPGLTLLVVVITGFAWAPMESQAWWSAGLHVLPAAGLLMAGMAIAARPVASLGWTDRGLLALVCLASTGFWTAGLFSIVMLAATRFYVRAELDRREKFLSRVGGVLMELAPAILIALISLMVIMNESVGRYQQPPVALGDLLVSLTVAARYGLGAHLLGLRVDWNTAQDVRWMVTAAAVPLIAGAMALSLYYRPRAVWLWLGFWAYAAMGWTLIALERVGAFGTTVMVTTRYSYVPFVVFIAVVILALNNRYGEPRTQIPAPPRLLRWTGLATAAALLVMTNVISGETYAGQFLGNHSRVFVENMANGVPGEAAGNAVRVGNRVVPPYVIPSWFGDMTDMESWSLIAPHPIEVVRWSEASHFVGDFGNFLPIADLPELVLQQEDGRETVFKLLPALNPAGHVDAPLDPADRQLRGWRT